MTAADRDELVEVLAGHVESGGGQFCSCTDEVLATSWEAHLAAVVREWLAGEVEAERDEWHDGFVGKHLDFYEGAVDALDSLATRLSLPETKENR